MDHNEKVLYLSSYGEVTKDARMVRKYMHLRNSGLLYESLFPIGDKKHPDIYYDEFDYMWKGVLPSGERMQGDIRSIAWHFVGKDIRYRYSLNGQDKKTRMFEKVVQEAVEAPECFSVENFADDYSKQEYEYLQRLTEALQRSRSVGAP